MAYTTINKSTDYFNTKLFTGNGADGNAVTNVGHSPDFVWIKQRNEMSHRLYDKIRGVNSALLSDGNSAENQYSAYGQFESFDSDGFTVGAGTSNGAGTNQNGQSICSWNWKANGQGSANTDGSINTTYTSVNTTAGFSISKFTGTGSAATVGHGLGSIPNVIIIKRLDQASNWCVYHTGLGGADHNVFLNTTSSIQTDTAIWNNTLPTTSVFSLGANADANGSGAGHIAYCFAEKTGYSKFGTYTGNGDANAPFVYTGFKPAVIIIKRTDSTGNWNIIDNKRLGRNPNNPRLTPNAITAEDSADATTDILSNGFKLRSTSQYVNYSGGSFIFMAFAEAPLVGTNNIPCTAR